MNKSSNSDSCVIELHYCLNDGSHSVDAFIFNKCEREFLNIVREVIQKSGAEVEVEIEALGQGGLRSWIKINASIMAREIIVGVIVANLCAPISTTKDELMSKAIEVVFESKKIREQKEQRQIAEFEYEIAEYKLMTEKLFNNIDLIKLRKNQSGFYDSLYSCHKVEKVIAGVADKIRGNNYIQCEVERTNFSEFIISDDGFGPFEDDEAIIEITSPVIKGKGKWAGIYNGNKISFKLCDRSFINKVRTGQIPFREGSSIICHLVIRKKIDNGGKVRMEYEVIDVVDFQY